MRRWGAVVTAVYTLVLLILVVPGAVAAFGVGSPFWPQLVSGIIDVYQQRGVWIVLAVPILCQATLLFLSVDTSRRRLKPRSHIFLSCTAAGLLLMMLFFAGSISLSAGILHDHFDRIIPDSAWIYAILAGLWLAWGVIFYLFSRRSENVVKRATRWLLRASVLELLIAVPCHVFVRRRDDCCAPAVTSFGIATGIAIMLLSFGPSVLFLYNSRLDGYSDRALERRSAARLQSSPHA